MIITCSTLITLLGFGQDVSVLERELDETIPKIMATNKVPGVSMAVVGKDSVMLERHFGYANLEEKISVTAIQVMASAPFLNPLRLGAS